MEVSRVKIGIILPLGENSDTSECPSYKEVKGWAKQAEANGFDSVWVYDHLIYRFPEKPTQGVWEAFTFWAALAEATERVELGCLVLCTAFRNPAVTAKMAVTLDHISGGRVILGLGAGWHEPEFDAFGISFANKVDRFEEAIKIITPLVHEGKVDFTGKYYSAPNGEMKPAPERKIPVLIASKGPRMLGLTAQYADQWNTAWFGDFSGSLERRTEMNSALAAAGRDPETLEVTVGVQVNFPDLDDLGEAAQNKDKWISGSVEDVAAALAEYQANGVGHVIVNLHPLTTESIDRLTEALILVKERVAV
jgi:alkanesulfonate monooxygenase SsuD/methylene tetrahydromethanopterin reductase-like flavin-dependent oxidoreductase (luciferase family)